MLQRLFDTNASLYIYCTIIVFLIFKTPRSREVKKIKKMHTGRGQFCFVEYTSVIRKRKNLAKSVEGFFRNLVLKSQKSQIIEKCAKMFF